MVKLVLIRHGESTWNKENKFTGWTDVPLTKKGEIEAEKAGIILKDKGFTFDVSYTSVLKRAIDTLKIVLKVLDSDIKINYSYKLNERHYGALQGLNKDEMRKKYGDNQVFLWRRSANAKPPALDLNDARSPYNDLKYKGIKDLPLSESLTDTMKRVLEYYKEFIEKDLKDKKNVLVVAHGNSLRALIKYLDGLSDEEVMKLELETGIPICYELDDNLHIIDKYNV